MATSASTLNLNAAQCIKSKSGFGETAYHNICDGSVAVVGWGVGDWLTGTFIILMMLALLGGIVLCGALAAAIIRDEFCR